MAGITKTTTKAGEVRYRVRFRVNGRTAELWCKNIADARATKTRVESEAQAARPSTLGPAPERSTTTSSLGSRAGS